VPQPRGSAKVASQHKDLVLAPLFARAASHNARR